MMDHEANYRRVWEENAAAIIPCYNAGARIRPVVEGVLAILNIVYVVDDGSTDGAMETLRDLPVQVLPLPKNEGKGHALLKGIRHALTDPRIHALCLLDADGQHDPAEIPRLLETWEREHADLVIGSREFQRGQVPWGSWLGNTVTRTVTGWLLGQHLPDTQCGFRVLSREFAADVLETVPGGRYELEMEVLIKAIRQGRKVVSTPIATRYEPGNRSSHFHKFRDSFLIYARFLGALYRNWR